MRAGTEKIMLNKRTRQEPKKKKQSKSEGGERENTKRPGGAHEAEMMEDEENRP